jgi:hypothetical protein
MARVPTMNRDASTLLSSSSGQSRAAQARPEFIDHESALFESRARCASAFQVSTRVTLSIPQRCEPGAMSADAVLVCIGTRERKIGIRS